MYFEEFSQGDKFTTRSRVVTGTDMDVTIQQERGDHHGN